MMIFLLVVFLQRDITQSFAVENAVLSKLQGTLPQAESGYFNSDKRGTGSLESANDWYDWIGGILDSLYLDATCGALPSCPDRELLREEVLFLKKKTAVFNILFPLSFFCANVLITVMFVHGKP